MTNQRRNPGRAEARAVRKAERVLRNSHPGGSHGRGTIKSRIEGELDNAMIRYLTVKEGTQERLTQQARGVVRGLAISLALLETYDTSAATIKRIEAESKERVTE